MNNKKIKTWIAAGCFLLVLIIIYVIAHNAQQKETFNSYERHEILNMLEDSDPSNDSEAIARYATVGSAGFFASKYKKEEDSKIKELIEARKK